MNKPKRGEIYWANLTPVRGSEQGGFRPVLILSNNIINAFSPVVMIAPLTRYVTSDKVYPTDVLIKANDIKYIEEIKKEVERFSKEGHVLDPESDSKVYCDQARSISKKRLIKRLGELASDAKTTEITDGLAEVFAITACNSCYTPMKPMQLKCGNPRCRKRHRKKCEACEEVLPLGFKYCFNCGKGA